MTWPPMLLLHVVRDARDASCNACGKPSRARIGACSCSYLMVYSLSFSRCYTHQGCNTITAIGAKPARETVQ
jgi:hypothetical protein